MLPARSTNNSQAIPTLHPMSHSGSGIESAFENLLRAVQDALGAVQNKASEDDQKLVFEVGLNGQLYHVRIIQVSQSAEAPLRRLSLRELEIAQLISKGMPNKAIAVALSLRPCTVSTYTKRIYLKLNVNSRAEMVAKVLGEHFMRMPARLSKSS